MLIYHSTRVLAENTQKIQHQATRISSLEDHMNIVKSYDQISHMPKTYLDHMAKSTYMIQSCKMRLPKPELQCKVRTSGHFEGISGA